MSDYYRAKSITVNVVLKFIPIFMQEYRSVDGDGVNRLHTTLNLR